MGQDRGPVAAMDLQVFRVAEVRASQTVGMEEADEDFIAGRFAHQVIDREIQGRLAFGVECSISPHLN